MKKPLVLICFILFLLAALFGCSSGLKTKQVDLSKKAPTEIQAPRKSLKIAVSGMISPKATFVYYRQILDYLGKKLGLKVDLVQRDTYEEVNQFLENGGLDVAFVCSGPYVDGHDKFGLELLVAPASKAYGKPVYYSYIIVPQDSGVTKFSELKGKIFAYTDPLSNTGKLYPDYLISKLGKTPDAFFSSYIYTKNHDRSISAVAEELVDGAAVDSLIWEYHDRTNPVYTSRTKIIQKSEPYGIPPVAVTARLDPELKAEIKKILLNMHKDSEGRKILDKLMIARFVEVEDSNYDSIREMKKWVESVNR